jgi:hypothetical protein
MTSRPIYSTVDNKEKRGETAVQLPMGQEAVSYTPRRVNEHQSNPHN